MKSGSTVTLRVRASPRSSFDRRWLFRDAFYRGYRELGEYLYLDTLDCGRFMPEVLSCDRTEQLRVTRLCEARRGPTAQGALSGGNSTHTTLTSSEQFCLYKLVVSVVPANVYLS